MKSLAYLFLVLLLACQTAPKEKQADAQNKPTNETQDTENKEVVTDKNALFQLSVYIPASENLSESAGKLVETKLTQLLTANGIAGEMRNPRFAVAPRVRVLSKNVTSTAPTMHANRYQVTFYVGDIRSKTLFSSASVEFKGEKYRQSIAKNDSHRQGKNHSLL